MASFTFNGFPVGSSVALSAAQGAFVAANSVTTWGQGDMANVDILVTTQPVITAPAPVWLEAIGISGFNVVGGPGPGAVYDPSFHDITYVWTIRDAPLPPYQNVQNLVDGWDNANVAYGKKVAFRFPNPGIYEIDLLAVDSDGTEGRASASVTVVPSGDVYAAANTIVFAQDGNFAGAPGGQQVTSIPALKAAIQARTTATRISFKPGEVIQNVDLYINEGRFSYMDTWTPGSKVTLKARKDTGDGVPQLSFGDDFSDTQVTLRDIAFEGDWDPTTETGDTGNGAAFNFYIAGTAFNMIVHDCTFTGLNSCDVTVNSERPGSRILFTDCIWSDWKHYGVYSFYNQDGAYGLLGCQAAQNPLALAGGPKENLSNDHGPLRLERQKHVYIACSDFFACTGWSGTPPRAANACLRINSKGYPDWSAICDRVVAEGGYIQLKVDGENDDTLELPGNFLVDKMVLMGSPRSLGWSNLHFGGTTIRNSFFVMPDTTMYDGIADSFINISPNNPAASNDAPMAFYNNTFYSPLAIQTQMFFSNGPSLWSDFTAENNVMHIPNAPSPVLSPADPDTTTALGGISPRFAQVRWNFALETGSLGSVPNGASFALPYASIGRRDELGFGPAGGTDQAYWQAALAAGDTLHMISVNGTTFYAERGEFAVSYSDPANVVITNFSGQTWSGGYFLRLDRKSYLDAELPAQTQYSSAATIPTCRPQVAPGPQNTEGALAHHDLYGAEREQPVAMGAIER